MVKNKLVRRILGPKGYSGVGGHNEIQEDREITNMKYVWKPITLLIGFLK